MRIGDLAERTGVPARMLRYYEGQGLLRPERRDNGYREYADGDVELVHQIRSLISAGVPTRLVRIVLEMREPTWTRQCSRDFAEQLEGELATLDDKIACLTASRRTLADYLEQARVDGEPARRN
ncbi:MerR family transcriptional regulator [Nocardioides cheoyonin]|uniref:MerR family transcriptional regulator n=1 Tax=Nocardioides cheoyonin TaxID=3156615 RepID=UPI0032B3FBF3